MVYRKDIVATNQKSTRDRQEIKRKESKHTIENHQHVREESKRIRKELNYKNNLKTITKIVITTYLPIITLYVND